MQVWVLSGAGNDFSVVDARHQSLPLPQLAIECCAQLGTDGFVALGQAEKGDIRLHFYNRDGSRAAFCGNGARCLCRFAWELGAAPERLLLESDAGLHECRRLAPEDCRVALPPPEFLAPELVKVGVPHLLIKLPQLTLSMQDALRDRAAALRKKWDANVNFYAPLDANTIRLLTFERGVEDFTLSCGSGCGAVAAHLGPGSWDIQTLGGELQVENTASSLSLTGPTKVVQVVTL